MPQILNHMLFSKLESSWKRVSMKKDISLISQKLLSCTARLLNMRMDVVKLCSNRESSITKDSESKRVSLLLSKSMESLIQRVIHLQ